MSGGQYENVRPQLRPAQSGIDESTDAYDTIDYLVKHVPENNGAVGMWGISYPGFYAAVGAINSHPALKAVSPQAPVSDWFLGDDVHHNGAFFLQDNFGFDTWFDMPRKGPEQNHDGLKVEEGDAGAYAFFLGAGALANLDSKYLKGRIPYWNEIVQHGSYDAYWKARALPEHLKNIKAAVLVVGGLFDAEDMWGALNDYQAIRRQNPTTPNYLVMGPWFHGMWASGAGDSFGDFALGAPTSQWYRDNIEFPFFERYLRGVAVPPPAIATMFDAGVNKWKTFGQWPPAKMTPLQVFFADSKRLLPTKPTIDVSNDTYENDPQSPTPYMADLKSKDRPTEYMIEDQRWAEARPDVLTYKGDVLTEPVTVAGPVDVDLWVSTTGTDADFVVKVIDLWPTDSPDKTVGGGSLAGYEELIRADVMRGKFRNSFEMPEPFVPGTPTRVHFKLNDVLHTFRPKHRMVVQVQSSWFPLVDRNPNRFEDIYTAKDADFQKAMITLYHEAEHPSSITFGTLNK
jgi:putative CocE/NonD family hydrolase